MFIGIIFLISLLIVCITAYNIYERYQQSCDNKSNHLCVNKGHSYTHIFDSKHDPKLRGYSDTTIAKDYVYSICQYCGHVIHRAGNDDSTGLN